MTIKIKCQILSIQSTNTLMRISWNVGSTLIVDNIMSKAGYHFYYNYYIYFFYILY